VKRIGQAESDLRPSCLETIKTASHIFACEQRVEWQATFLTSLRKLLAKLCTQADLQMILMVGIQGALQDDPLFDMPTDNRERSFETSVSSQNDVGWSHLLRGRFSHHWVQPQQDHVDRKDEVSSKKFTGQTSCIIFGRISTLPGNHRMPISTAWTLPTKKKNAKPN
jgi:hypothetical protein